MKVCIKALRAVAYTGDPTDNIKKYGYRDRKAQTYYGQMTVAQAAEPCWRLQTAWPLLDTDVSPGGAAVPEAGLGITNEGAFWQK